MAKRRVWQSWAEVRVDGRLTRAQAEAVVTAVKRCVPENAVVTVSAGERWVDDGE